MKLAKISLATVVAFSALSGVSFANSLEEAIKNVGFNGYLRYRLDSDVWTNRGGGGGGEPSSEAKHKYRALANLKFPAAEGVSFNLSALYLNERATTNTGAGKKRTGEGEGLGAGEDGDFGVSTYYMTFMPKASQTTISVGKQLIDTPLTNASDLERGTGIYVLNRDVPNWTFTLGAFDTFALLDSHPYGSDTRVINSTTSGSSYTEPFYVASAMAEYGDFSAEVWGYHIHKVIKSALYTNVAYRVALNEDMGARISLAYAKNEVNNEGAGLIRKAGALKNDLYKTQVDFIANPVKFAVGYLGNSADGFSVALSSSAKGFIDSGTMGQLWWQNYHFQTSIGLFSDNGSLVYKKEKQRLGIFYANVAFEATDNVKLSLIYAGGKTDFTAFDGTTSKRKITEITPMAEYNYTKNLSFLTYYAMLKTETPGRYKTEKRNRFRFQTLYRF
ncbi:MAG: major outer membrane protein [Wolinella sp.]